MEEENLLDHVNQTAAPALAKAIATFEDHPLIGEARSLGMLGALQFTPDKSRRVAFNAPKGTIGEIARDACFANDIVMRHVGDRMIVSPPLIMTEDDAKIFVDRATRALDQTYDKAKAEGLLEAA